ncbi:Aste57867_17172 [Aphanomyces stellatus]|uniref:Aste57867_17172 protein n=1 Tax=Aphanomyces stellatus TaxID=120398 RepID=A0A485LAR4_9STRA|nr:hypothetical protein As57867_017113 [Aphanomyces stellatus]VFT93929.1 Aste57867_17172 [Aphanomyces stellatus]
MESVQPTKTDPAARRRAYRRQDREGLLYLRSRVQALALELQQTKRGHPGLLLSWQDVAKALQSSRTCSQHKNESLKAQVAYFRGLACHFMTCIGQSIGFDTLSPTQRTWQDAYLPMDGPTRRLAMDWIAKRLLHSVDAMVAAANLPYTMDDVVQVQAVARGESCVVHCATQTIVLASVQDVMQGLLWVESNLPRQVLAETTTSQYARHDMPFGDTRSFPMHMLMCHTWNDRFVLCRTSVTDDVLYPNELAYTNMTGWTVVEALGSNLTLVRIGRSTDGLRWADSHDYIPLAEQTHLLDGGGTSRSKSTGLVALERLHYEREALWFEQAKQEAQMWLQQMATSCGPCDRGSPAVEQVESLHP